MKAIRMVDLVTQYEKIKPEIDAALLDVVSRAAFINGAEVKAFQADLEQYLQVKHVIPCANGTDALQIAMMALGLKPGDEIITANFTYVATAEVIGLLGLTPVLVDADPHTFNIDPQAVEAAITSKTKAIVPVHLFGQCANMEPLLKLAEKHGLYIIEDTAQAIGADYIFSDGTRKKAGTMGHIGTTSFFPSKNLGGFGDGGAMMTQDDDLAAKMRMICNHGQSRLYYHDVIGVNSRLDTLQAAVLGIKLKKLDQYNEARQQLAASYNKAFAGIQALTVPSSAKNSTHVYHQYTLKLNGIDRAALKAYLEAQEIPSMIYYPVPLHMQQCMSSAKYQEGMFPVTENLCSCVISLPMHTEMDDAQLNHIVHHINSFCS
jgi:dTDP-4-amino-4,6-dideoxygalactose transaminase